MSIRFSEHGPLFPSALIDAILAGDVVFLCGSGISVPQLPNFQDLVDKVSARLDVSLNSSERLAYEDRRYEEVLGSLSRRLADPTAMQRAAAAELAVPAAPKLEHHKAALRLSRDVANRILLVTTNFDTLLERALMELDPGAAIVASSYAGQALPSPGSADFAGIIHLHGRLEDEGCELSETPLVLTSADYGDAYMRAGWASRFLFDLARSKTIVLLGYSAGDAPVRYFLSVLEADRDRFPDLKPVYAFAPYQTDIAEAERPWGTVAVNPIAYCELNSATGKSDHAVLWDDLAHLADLVERPRRMREARLAGILAQPPSSLTDSILAELRWLLAGGADPWPTVIKEVNDPRWFGIIQENELWSVSEAQWIIPAWIAHSFSDKVRFETAVHWLPRLGKPFADRLSLRLGVAKDLNLVWKKLWRQLLYVEQRPSGELDDRAITIKGRLESGVVLQDDIQRAIALISPVLKVEEPFRGFFDHEQVDNPETKEPQRLSDVARVTLDREDDYTVTELTAALKALVGETPRILRAACAALHAAAERAVDLELIDGDCDTTDYQVPSIEDHGQNAHHGGVQPLVRVIVDAFQTLAGTDRRSARGIAMLWQDIPGRIGTRLTLHAMRDARAFEADEAMRFLLDMDVGRFWNIRREIPYLIGERVEAADPDLVRRLEEKICRTGDAFFARYEIAPGQPDWRGYARDNDVWLRLSQLCAAERLSEEGEAELTAIKARRPHLNREIEDSDYFSIYSSGTRTVVGDIAPITSATPDDRLAVVHELTKSQDIEEQHGWSAYCRADPKGAFELLSTAELTPINLKLWDILLSALAHGDDASNDLRADLAVEATAFLATLAPDQLRQIASSLVDLFRFGPRLRFENREDWYDRLWASLALEEEEDGAAEPDLAHMALNAPAGRLAEVLLHEHEEARAVEGAPLDRQRARFSIICAEPRPAGSHARALFVQHAAFLLKADEALVRNRLVPALNGDDEGRALRAIFLSYGAITPAISCAMPQIILKAVREVRPGTGRAQSVAAAILRPALAELRQDETVQWGISMGEVRQLLREVAGEVRKACLTLLQQWMQAEEGGGSQGWTLMTGPFLEKVWPIERRFVDEANNMRLAELAVGSEEHFPAALAVVRPYITPAVDRRGSLHGIKSSSAPSNFPRQTLDLLWMLFGSTGPTSYDTIDLLETLVKADPAIEVDRRLQSLEQRCPRF